MSTTVIEPACQLVTTVTHQGHSVGITVVGVPGPAVPGTGGGAGISADPGNRAVAGTDGGVYVRDDLVHLGFGDPRPLYADGLGCTHRQEQSVTLADQLLRAGLVQDDTAVGQ